MQVQINNNHDDFDTYLAVQYHPSLLSINLVGTYKSMFYIVCNCMYAYNFVHTSNSQD